MGKCYATLSKKKKQDPKQQSESQSEISTMWKKKNLVNKKKETPKLIRVTQAVCLVIFFSLFFSVLTKILAMNTYDFYRQEKKSLNLKALKK